MTWVLCFNLKSTNQRDYRNYDRNNDKNIIMSQDETLDSLKQKKGKKSKRFEIVN